MTSTWKLPTAISALLGSTMLLFVTLLFADGPADNIPENVRQIPKPGIEVPADIKASLTTELTKLDAAIQALAKKTDAKTKSLLPDVMIYHKAVNDALKYQEFFDAKEFKPAADLLQEGLARAEQLAKGESPWTTATGLVVRGYVSKLDGSVQPYGLVVPTNYTPAGNQKWRLDFWFHGRGETLSEVNFLNDRRKNPGQFTAANTIVLHPYGRYSNANKFAGEIDALEALASVQARYAIDEDRIAVRGFSMGGASTWQLAVHYPTRWAAANPGAGFSETPEFLQFFQKEPQHPTPWEKKLWHWYDCTDWAVNLHHCPTVAYSGELDSQKQAADIMEKALAAQGITLTHIIGPNTKHAYEPKAREQVQGLMTQIIDRGRQRVPRTIHFTTYTTRYNECAWVRVDALAEHWAAAKVDARLGGHNNVVVKVNDNITGLTLMFPPGESPWDVGSPIKVELNDQTLECPGNRSDRSWSQTFHRDASGKWKLGEVSQKLSKHHGLSGPIDDAFLDSFVFVRPTGKFANPAVEKWSRSELERAIKHWRQHFRGEAPVKNDTEITDEDLQTKNVIVWGDPSSNQLLAKINLQLPIRTEKGNVVSDGGMLNYSAETHVPILVYPNPLNPQRYVVLNSSFTFREYAYLNNARQTPKLPDWAIIDMRTPPNSLWPGKVERADFFGEDWKLRGAK